MKFNFFNVLFYFWSENIETKMWKEEYKYILNISDIWIIIKIIIIIICNFIINLIIIFLLKYIIFIQQIFFRLDTFYRNLTLFS